MIRVVILGLFLVIVVLAVVILARRASPYRRCAKCGGKGYWEAVRQQEKCDVCRGSGRVRKHPEG